MKFYVNDWASECGDKLRELGYPAGNEYDGDPFEVMRKFAEDGLNVMFWKNRKDNKFHVFVDTRRFTQR